MDVLGVRVELPSNQPIVLLKESDGPRYLPIWIGASEATAIATAMEGIEPPRPLTHDLLGLAVEALGARVDQVVITEVRDSVYYADLILGTAGGNVSISCRPSDSIALAVRTGANVQASRSLLDEAGVEFREAADEEDEIARFREFLEEATVEDFLGES
jgi:hypothetical protein